MPTHQTVSDSRERAARILRDMYEGDGSSRELLASLEAEAPQSTSDAALTAELVVGVTRHRITCEHLGAHYYRGRWEGLRPSIRTVFALGVYQLCWLDRVPDHAAVDQSVRMALKYGKGTADMINAILRKIVAVRGPVVKRPENVDARRYLAVDADRGRVFSEDVFPNPERRPLEWLVSATGHPMYLIERWHRRFKPALTRQICDSGRFRRSLVLRANRVRISPEDLAGRLQSRGLETACITEAQAVIVRAAVRDGVRELAHAADVPEIGEGLCQPQDSTSQMVLATARLKEGQVVLDLCAGIGTKATHAAELMNDRGIVIATDIDDRKLVSVEQSAARLGLKSVRTTTLPQIESTLAALDRPVDVILVDAPCSNTGVLGRRPEARHRASHQNMLSLVAIQREILTRAVGLAGANTRIIYSTCSLEREENEDQSAWFCEQFPGWRLVESRLTLPDRDWDGGYTAGFERE